MKAKVLSLIILGVVSVCLSNHTVAATGITASVCPANPIVAGGAGFEPGGIILTSFDRNALWVYNIDSGRRYPLPETSPCGRNCRLSPDFRWITYFNILTNAFNQMRIDGTGRSLLAEYAADIEWWSENTLLIWTPGHQAYLREEGGTDREYLDVAGVISVQPGGRWGLLVEQSGEEFERALINLETRDMGSSGISDGHVDLGVDRSYFNAQAWSPDGQLLAYAAPALNDNGEILGTEIFTVSPGDDEPTIRTGLISAYGRARVNGLSVGELSWSPDSTRIAYWVFPMTGDDPVADAEAGQIHVLDTRTGDNIVYCGFETEEHSPNPPRLVWSPDGTHLAFGGNVPGDDRGYLLMTLNLETGLFTWLSEGIFPVLGAPDVVAWGIPPQ